MGTGGFSSEPLMAETTDGPTVPRKAKDYISQTPGSSLRRSPQVEAGGGNSMEWSWGSELPVTVG